MGRVLANPQGLYSSTYIIIQAMVGPSLKIKDFDSITTLRFCSLTQKSGTIWESARFIKEVCICPMIFDFQMERGDHLQINFTMYKS